MIDITFPFLFKAKANSYRIKRRKLIKDSTVASQEKAASTLAASIMDGAKPLTDLLKVTITISQPDNRRRDIDGPLKSLLDSLNGIAYKDDNQIRQLIVFKLVKQPTTFTRIVIEPL